MKQVDEVARHGYKLWGILNHKGEVVTGHDHPSAMTHSDLWGKVPPKERHKTVEWAQGKNDDLMVRTSSKEGIINAMKNWKKLPYHSSVTHDHCDNIDDVKHYGDSVKTNHALAKMNGLLNEYN